MPDITGNYMFCNYKCTKNGLTQIFSNRAKKGPGPSTAIFNLKFPASHWENNYYFIYPSKQKPDRLI